MDKNHVVYIGKSQYDEYYRLYEPAIKGSKARARQMETLLGGMLCNAACIMAHLGQKTYLLDTLNYSPMAERMMKELPELYGLDLSYVVRNPDICDSKCIILLEDDDRTILVTEDDNPSLIIDDKLSNLLNSASYIYSSFYDFERLVPKEETILKAKENGTKIAIDVDNLKVTDEFQWSFKLADLVFINEHGFANLAKGKTEEEAINEVMNNGTEILVITKGALGCEIITPDERFSVPCPNVKVIDTTGAGDTFNSSFLYALINGYDLHDCAVFASCAAGLAVTNVGARAGTSTEAELRELMKTF